MKVIQLVLIIGAVSMCMAQSSDSDDESVCEKLNEKQDFQDENDDGQYVYAELMRY